MIGWVPTNSTSRRTSRAFIHDVLLVVGIVALPAAPDTADPDVAYDVHPDVRPTRTFDDVVVNPSDRPAGMLASHHGGGVNQSDTTSAPPDPIAAIVGDAPPDADSTWVGAAEKSPDHPAGTELLFGFPTHSPVNENGPGSWVFALT